jgi:hypothetical protein
VIYIKLKITQPPRILDATPCNRLTSTNSTG